MPFTLGMLIRKAAATSAISYVSSAGATSNTLTMPSHTTGDVIIGAASRTNATIPTVPGGWTTITSTTISGYSMVVAYKIAASSSETFGTWTNGDAVSAIVYRGASGVGGSSGTTASSTTPTTAAISSLTVTNGTSWVVGMWGFAASAAAGGAPSGTTKRFLGNFRRIWDTNGGVSGSSYPSQSSSSTITSQNWSGIAVEIKSN